MLKTLLHLFLSSIGSGVQMPHCTPSGYATAVYTVLVTIHGLGLDIAGD